MAINHSEVDDMHHVIRLFEALLRLLLPAKGRHRSVGVSPAPAPTRYAVVPRVPARHTELLRGEDSALVRPYLVAHEERLQRSRRRVLWLASYGIDAGPRWIHGMKVAS
nr:hypothetical protein [Streptomyces piniterrae]